MHEFLFVEDFMEAVNLFYCCPILVENKLGRFFLLQKSKIRRSQ